MKNAVRILGLAGLVALAGCSGGSPDPSKRDLYIIVGEAPNKELKVSTDANDTLKVIMPVSVVSAVGHATFYNDEKLPRYVSVGGRGTKYNGEAIDVNADGIFDKISKNNPSADYSLGQLENVLHNVSDAIVSGKESIILE